MPSESDLASHTREGNSALSNTNDQGIASDPFSLCYFPVSQPLSLKKDDIKEKEKERATYSFFSFPFFHTLQ